MTPALIAQILCAVAWIVLTIYFVHAIVTAPMGREDPTRGFIRTDENGKDLE